jgi:predicted RNA binding protein YcfA (HicA-like mRNA interferase family)
MDMKDIEKAALEQGWRVGRTSSGHPRFLHPDPRQGIVIGSGTPGDRKSINNLLAQLKRRGFIWPWPPR